jgi:hypothetical protein
MGRVSRIMKAVSDKPKDTSASSAEKLGKAAAFGNAAAGPDADDLARLLACWPRMPKHFKDTILALVEITEGTQ